MTNNVYIGNSSIVVPQGKVVRYTVTKEGYYPQCGTLVMNKSQSINVELSTTPKHNVGDLITDENTGEVKAIVVGLDTANSKYFAVVTAKYRRLLTPNPVAIKDDVNDWTNASDLCLCDTELTTTDSHTGTYNTYKFLTDSTFLTGLYANVIKYDGVECPIVLPNKQEGKLIIENYASVDSVDPTAELDEYKNYTLTNKYVGQTWSTIGFETSSISSSIQTLFANSSNKAMESYSNVYPYNSYLVLPIIELPD